MDECFLCGKWVGRNFVKFQIASSIAPAAKIHPACLNGRSDFSVACAYHRWVGDIHNIARARMGRIVPNY